MLIKRAINSTRSHAKLNFWREAGTQFQNHSNNEEIMLELFGFNSVYEDTTF